MVLRLFILRQIRYNNFHYNKINPLLQLGGGAAGWTAMQAEQG